MDPSLVSSALCKRSQALFMQEMVSNFGENPFPSDHYGDIRTEAISTALKAEQSCEDMLAAREEQVNKINIISDEVDMEKVELARKLLAEKERLISRRDAIRSVLSNAHITAEELNAKKDRVKPLKAKRLRVEQLSMNCEALKQEIAELRQ